MSDERIVEYLRSRGHATPPLDLVGSVVEAIADAPRQRHNWFAPLIPGVAAVGVAAAVLVAVLLIGQSPVGGPRLTSPTGTPAPERADLNLLEPGATVTMDAVDATGVWGSITLTRGPDLGRNLEEASDAQGFGLEVHIAYRADRMPNPPAFGADDWTVVLAADGTPVGSAAIVLTQGPEKQPLGTYPGAIDIFTTPTEGTLWWVVPIEAADDQLELVYRPSALDQPVASLPLRLPNPAPSPFATPEATPVPAGYVEKEGHPFAVLDSAEADRLFDAPDTCTNPQDGYTVTFPDDWYTNTEINETPACVWFTPDFFEVTVRNQAPDEIWFSIGIIDSGIGYTSLTDVSFSEELVIDGFDGRRVEFNPSPVDDPEYRAYHYVVHLGTEVEGPNLVAQVANDGVADYELAKAVLDRIMASLQFEN